MKTGIITFNVRERGRKHRGQERNFDTVTLAQLINGPEVQERVRNRDLKGYFGHWPRVMFGIEPGEGGIYKGQQITLEPALLTTTLSATSDGTISHESEFLDTAPGRTAKRVFSSRAGGFSSAINCREYAGRDVPIGFHGFDYVMEPNFTTNRGYALDGVWDGVEGVLDEVLEGRATLSVLDGLYSRLQGDYDRVAETVTRLQAENAELVAMLAANPKATHDDALTRLARLDGASSNGASLIKTVARMDRSRLGRLAAEFSGMRLDGTDARVTDDDDKAHATLVTNVAAFVSRLYHGRR